MPTNSPYLDLPRRSLAEVLRARPSRRGFVRLGAVIPAVLAAIADTASDAAIAADTDPRSTERARS